MAEGITGNQLAPGVQTVYRAPFELSDAQIKAMPGGTPGIILAATEVIDYDGIPASLPHIVSIEAILDTRGGAYTNCDASVTLFGNLSTTGDEQVTNYANIKARLEDTGVFKIGLNTSQIILTEGTPNGAEVFTHFINDNFYDNGLALKMNNGSNGALTGGHASNSLRGVVNYSLMDLSYLS